MFTAGDKITAKANGVLVLVRRTCRDLKDIDTMKTLYCSLVRPLLEYSCETWNPHTKRKTNVDKLEAVQRRATRWITRSDHFGVVLWEMATMGKIY